MPTRRLFVDRLAFHKWLGLRLSEADSNLCRRRFERLGISDLLLAGADAGVKGTTAHPPIWNDLWALYSIIHKEKPKLILEYGSGITTVLMARALWETGSGRIISLENVEHWGEVTQRRLPDYLRDICSVRICQPEVVTMKGYFDRRLIGKTRMRRLDKRMRRALDRPLFVGAMGFRYKESEGLDPDLILIDGPNPRWTTYYRDSFGGVPPAMVFDPLIHERTYKPGTRIVLDWRLANARFLAGNFSRNWRHTGSFIRRQNHLVLVGE